MERQKNVLRLVKIVFDISIEPLNLGFVILDLNYQFVDELQNVDRIVHHARPLTVYLILVWVLDRNFRDFLVDRFKNVLD